MDDPPVPWLADRPRAAWLASRLVKWMPLALFIPVTVPLVLLLLRGWIAGTDWPGNDAALYRSAAAEWLAGGNPCVGG
jgi:hypothetical protein